MRREEIKIIKKSSGEYPARLKEISDPPKQLYVRGNLPKNCELNFAIVGTRACSGYGKTAAFKFAKELAELGFNIISGLAFGIDTEAHLGTLAGGGKTVAILGSGVDDNLIYPRSNLKLAHKIIESGGAVVSEYEPGFKPWQWSFPERNRIISGLSRGVLVIEAPEKSGALITAKLALEQNREVFATPGPIFSKNSAGTNYLIKNGAKAVTDIDDILEELNLTEMKDRKIESVKQSLSRSEEKILEAIGSETLHLDKICETCRMPIIKVLQIISELEIRGIIKNIGGNRFVKL